LVVSPGTSLASQRSEADRIWQAYEDHWQGVNTFSATFHQTIEVAGIGGVVTSSGRLYFEKPDKLRWNYEEGNPQSVVGDGKFIWIHQPDLSQVYRVDYRSAFGTGGLVTLLAGREGLAERYGFELLDSSAAGSVRLRLTPREGAGETLEIVMRDNDFALERVVVTDPAGSTTHLAFSNIRHNDKLAEDLFVFTPPDGIDIITDPVRSP
jgi:outer membrane lipoprotein carrier protein